MNSAPDVFVPPRHGKSLLASQVYPVYSLGAIQEVDHPGDLTGISGRRLRKRRLELRERSIYTQAVFPELQISEDSNAMNRFTTTLGGDFYAVGVGAAITGRGADLLIVDDPICNQEDARSEPVLRTLRDWFATVAFTRLAPGGAVVRIGTRWSHGDLIGHLIANHSDEKWDYLNMPAIAEADADGRKVGDPLWPERFDLADLNSKRAMLGSVAFGALYQGRPSLEQGGIFQVGWWQRYDHDDRPSSVGS